VPGSLTKRRIDLPVRIVAGCEHSTRFPCCLSVLLFPLGLALLDSLCLRAEAKAATGAPTSARNLLPCKAPRMISISDKRLGPRCISDPSSSFPPRRWPGLFRPRLSSLPCLTKGAKRDVSCVSLHCSRTALASPKPSQARPPWPLAQLCNLALPPTQSTSAFGRFVSLRNLSVTPD
jgi:hypothetical protein